MLGYVSELLVYNVSHNTATRQAIEGYLAWKWNTKSYLPTNHPYYSVRPPFTPTSVPAFTSISTTVISTFNAQINWLANGQATSYNYTLTSNGITAQSSTISGAFNGVAFNILNSATVYNLSVSGFNASGGAITSITFSTLYIAPQAPTSITSTSESNASAGTSVNTTIKWTGGNFVSSYIYFLNGVQTVPAIDAGVIGKSVTFTGLSTTTTYAMSLIGINSLGSTLYMYNPNTPIQAFSGAQLWFDGADPLGTGIQPANGATVSNWYSQL
jgi:hypothetical protein